MAASNPVTGEAFAISITQSLTPASNGNVGAVALSSNVGGTGVNAPSIASQVAGVGGAFSVQGNSGDAQTIAAVGTNITGGFDADVNTTH